MVWLFSATLFLSAALLFFIELMFGSMILPKFGGTPAVWNTCMLFFQAAMLAGYGYAHWAPARLGVRRHLWLHLAVLLLPLAFVPIAVKFDPPGDGAPVLWVLLILAVSIGVPFFVVATTNPLLQKWFTETGHTAAADPYFLYAASNAGSMVALLAYPALPALVLNSQHLGLQAQSWCWAAGYGVLLLMMVACASFVWRAPPVEARVDETSESSAEAPTALRIARWVALAFFPSSLMLGVTTHLSTDLSPGPLIWVLPLAIYLLSFILVFARMPAGVHDAIVRIMPMVVLMQAYLLFTETMLPKVPAIALHLLTLFLVSMVCHGELARNRPDPRFLTGFYLWMSVGGVLGGIFNALAAPVIFNTVVEYPLVMALACLFMPRREGEGLDKPFAWQEVVLPAGLGLLAVALVRMAIDLLSASSGDEYTSPGLKIASLIPLQAAVFVLAWVLSRRALDAPIDRRFVGALMGGVIVGGVVQVLAAQPHASVPMLTIGWAMSGPLAMLFVCMVMPFAGRAGDDVRPSLDLAVAAAFGLLAIEHVLLLTDRSGMGARAFAWLGALVDEPEVSLQEGMERAIRALQLAPALLFCFAWARRPMRFSMALCAVWLATGFATVNARDAILLRERSFFGTVKLQRSLLKNERADNVPYHQLIHGTTLHGRQELDADNRPVRDAEPTIYYHRSGPIGQVLAMLAEREPTRPVAVIGLGIGTTAAYARPGQEFVFYEIDATVRKVAEDTRYFTYLHDARQRGAKIDFVLGDARLSLERDGRDDGHFRLIAVDAFSSDAIPVHLITHEAMQLYMRKLAPDGVLAFHISNRYLDLEPVLAALAKRMGLRCIVRRDFSKDADGVETPGKMACTWVLFTRPEHCDKALGSIRNDIKNADPNASEEERSANARKHWYWIEDRANWYLDTHRDVELWTDDYHNLLSIFRW